MLALFLGGAGGTLFNLVDLPLAWMLGAMVTTALASIAGVKLSIPRGLRDPWITILGVMLGSNFSADTFHSLLDWIPSIIALPVYVVALSFVGRTYLRRIAGFEPQTAYFASAPGGLAEMILIGDHYGGDMRRIALMHSTRVFLVVILLPLSLSLFVSDLVLMPSIGRVAPTARELVVLITCAICGFWIARRVGLPAPQMLGPMILSALAHLVGWVEAAPPIAFIAGAQIVMGSSLGARFSGIQVHEILHAVVVCFGLTTILLSLSATLAWVMSQMVAMPFIVLLIAFSPGGVAEMGLVALAIGADPTFVACIHILRIALVIVLAPAIFNLSYLRKGNRPQKKRRITRFP